MEKYSLELINSNHSLDDGEKIILDLLFSKIKFLNEQIFSEQVRFGDEPSHAKNRVNALNEEVKKIKSIIDKFKNTHKSLKIDCKINLEII